MFTAKFLYLTAKRIGMEKTHFDPVFFGGVVTEKEYRKKLSQANKVKKNYEELIQNAPLNGGKKDVEEWLSKFDPFLEFLQFLDFSALYDELIIRSAKSNNEKLFKELLKRAFIGISISDKSFKNSKVRRIVLALWVSYPKGLWSGDIAKLTGIKNSTVRWYLLRKIRGSRICSFEKIRKAINGASILGLTDREISHHLKSLVLLGTERRPKPREHGAAPGICYTLLHPLFLKDLSSAKKICTWFVENMKDRFYVSQKLDKIKRMAIDLSEEELMSLPVRISKELGIHLVEVLAILKSGAGIEFCWDASGKFLGDLERVTKLGKEWEKMEFWWVEKVDEIDKNLAFKLLKNN